MGKGEEDWRAEYRQAKTERDAALQNVADLYQGHLALEAERDAALARAEAAEARNTETTKGLQGLALWQTRTQLKDAEAVIEAVDKDDAEAVVLAIRYRNKYPRQEAKP